MGGNGSASRPRGGLDYEPLKVAVGKEAVMAYRAGCVVPDYDERTGFDEQKARLVRRGRLGRVFGLVSGIICALVGLLLVLGGLLFLVTGSPSTGAWVSVVFGILIGWAGIASLRAARRQAPDVGLWERRYRLDSFARANGLSYVFRSDPNRWPGMVSEIPRRSGGQFSEVSKLTDLLQGSDAQGRPVMACCLEITRCRGAITARNLRFDYYTVVALRLATTTKQVYLKHRRSKHPDAADLLSQNYALDDPFAVTWSPDDDDDDYYARARPVLSQEVLALILDIAPECDLFLSGGWLYVMRPYEWAAIDKKFADPELMRERFEIAARLGPAVDVAIAARAAAQARGEKLPEVPLTGKQRKKRAEAALHTDATTRAALNKHLAKLKKTNDPMAGAFEQALARQREPQPGDPAGE